MRVIQSEAVDGGAPLTPIVAAALTLADTLIEVGDKLEKVARDMELSIDHLDLRRDKR
jgi:hypothetical protein